MRSIVLDAQNKKMRLSGPSPIQVLSSVKMRRAPQRSGFVVEDLGPFIFIKGTLDWKGVLAALKLIGGPAAPVAAYPARIR